MRVIGRLGKMCVSLALAAGTVAAGAAASADTPVGGCPSGFQLLSVTSLSSEGYHLPALIDDPNVALGNPNSAGWPQQPGNGDGYVCGRAEGNRTTGFGGQLYLFVDNQLPVSS